MNYIKHICRLLYWKLPDFESLAYRRFSEN